MLKWFVCPDDEQVLIEECLNRCRMGERCLTQPTLRYLSKEREWSGEPSTTQLLNGTMYEFLKLTNDYGIHPESRAFALLGSIHHKTLEEQAKELGLPAEISLTDNDKNIFDLLEVEFDEENLPIYTLTDYKTWGSFKVAKTLGIKVVREVDEPYTNKQGKQSIRKKKIFEEVSEEGDNGEVTYQLNRYRYILEDKYGINVKNLFIQITVRDGGLQVATSRGVDKLIYKRSIADVPRHVIDNYFGEKHRNLLKALEDNEWDMPCTPEERWGGTRCERFCEVAPLCKFSSMDKLGLVQEIPSANWNIQYPEGTVFASTTRG